jgi:hypothetical protein
MRHHTTKPGRDFADLEQQQYDVATAFAVYEDNASYLQLFADNTDHPDLIAALQAQQEKLRAEAVAHGHFFV